jgi:hypothetical protein
MKRILAVMFFVLAFAVNGFAVNTTTIGTSRSVIEITGLDADWTWETDLASQERVILDGRVQRIVFYPSAASDRMIIRDGGIDNATYFDSGAVSGADDPRTVTYVNPVHVNLVIDITDCTLSTAANAKVVIYLETKR